MDKAKLRKDLLEGMCRCAEKIDLYFYSGRCFTNIHFDGRECPEPFKPAVADKAMFNRIIDLVIDNIAKEYNEGGIKLQMKI